MERKIGWIFISFFYYVHDIPQIYFDVYISKDLSHDVPLLKRYCAAFGLGNRWLHHKGREKPE